MGALTTYLTATRNLLQNPSAPKSLYATPDLTTYINTARAQLAGESESIRFIASLPVTAGTRVYTFQQISLTGAAGIQLVLNARTLWYLVGAGQRMIRQREFEWFSFYNLNTATPPTGAPAEWAQFGQGADGSIYLSPVPDTTYTIKLDTVCSPSPLLTDSDPEAIPPLWGDAVPYYAAYLALLSSQTGERIGYGEKMFTEYSKFVQRARRAATPSVLPGNFAQTGNPVQQNQLGIAPARGGG